MVRNPERWIAARAGRGGLWFRSVCAWALLVGSGSRCEAAASAKKESRMHIGTRKQVLWDDSGLESHTGIRFVMHPGVRSGQRLLQADKPWEAWMAGGYGTVIRDGGRFRMWYSARVSVSQEYMAYAESPDGITWTKPELGLIDFRGSRANNLLTPGSMRPHGASVWIDPNAPSDERYKLLFGQYPMKKDEPKAFLTQAVSSDGIRFRFTGRSILEARHGEKGLAVDTHNLCFWDESLGKYVLYVRKRPARSVGRSVSSDPFVFPHPENVLEPENWRDADYYNPGVFRYAEAERAYVALVPVFFHPMDPGQTSQPADGQPFLEFEYVGKPQRMPPPDSLDVHLFTSRDGVRWQRQGDGRPIIRLGPEGAFDSRQIYPFANYVVVGDEIWIYYLGADVTHLASLAAKNMGTVSRAVFRLDGFMSADAGREEGVLVTKPLVFEGDCLEVNYDASAGGRLDLEILDESGKPIPGYTFSDHDRAYYNFVHGRMTFRGSPDVSALAGRAVRLRFRLRACSLYAFRFRKTEGL